MQWCAEFLASSKKAKGLTPLGANVKVDHLYLYSPPRRLFEWRRIHGQGEFFRKGAMFPRASQRSFPRPVVGRLGRRREVDKT